MEGESLIALLVATLSIPLPADRSMTTSDGTPSAKSKLKAHSLYFIMEEKRELIMELKPV